MFSLYLTLSRICARSCIHHLMTKRLKHVNEGLRHWGRTTTELMQIKLQGPRRGPSNVFTWSYVFVKFAKVGYFNCHYLTLPFPSILTSLLLFLSILPKTKCEAERKFSNPSKIKKIWPNVLQEGLTSFLSVEKLQTYHIRKGNQRA